MDDQINLEAHSFGEYILSGRLGTVFDEAYERGLRELRIDASPRELKLIRMAISQPWLTPIIDAGLAITEPNNSVRKRLILIAALCESNPLYADYFLPVSRDRAYFFCVAYATLRAFFRAIAGLLLVALVR